MRRLRLDAWICAKRTKRPKGHRASDCFQSTADISRHVISARTSNDRYLVAPGSALDPLQTFGLQESAP